MIPQRQPDNKHQENTTFLALDIQLREYVKNLSRKISHQQNVGYNQHFIVSLKVNAKNVNLEDENLTGVTDYIQYGISQEDYKNEFIRMF